MAEDSVTREGLVRELKFPTAVTVVVGTVIGSGIFIGANRVAAGVDSVWALFAIWIGAGLLTMLGALTYAEFGALYPRSGGDYVYVQKSISPFFGFFTGWASFALNLPASVAALALVFASQMDILKPVGHVLLISDGFSIRFTALAIIALFTIVNYLGVRQGGAAQRILTFAKVALILFLVAVGLFGPGADADNLTPVFGASKGTTVSVALALVAALFAYDGWNAVSRVAGEIHDPQRTVPRALITGVLTIITIYVLVNLGYLMTLGLEGMAHADPANPNYPVDRLIATRAAETAWGTTAKAVVAIIIGVSILGTINGLTLSGPRIYFAMARDRLFFPRLGASHPRRHTPHVSIIVQGILSGILVLFFTFEQLQSYVVLAAWVAYALTGYGVIRHRRLHPELVRPYKVPFFPAIPILFILLAVAFLIYLVVDAAQTWIVQGKPAEFLYLLANVAILALAWPAYQILQRRYAAAATPGE